VSGCVRQVVHWDVERAAKLLKADLEWRAKTRPWALRPSHMPSACRQQAWQVLMGPTRSRALLKWKQHPRHASGQHTLQPEAVNSSRPTTWLRRKMSLATRLKRRELHPPYHCPPLMQWRYTRHGLPITVLEVRHWYPERYKGGKREEALHVAYHMEHYIRRMPFRRGRRVERCCIIISLKGFRASTVPHVVHCVNILRKHYPGRLGIACLIDVPNYFYPFWRVISPYLDEEIMSKVHFLPSSVKGTEAAIEWCNKQKLPPFRDASLLV